MIDLVAKTYRQHLVRRVGNVVISRAVSLGIAPSYYVLLTIRGRRSGAERTIPIRLMQHDGQEWLYVLSGRLRLLLGDRDFVIKPGEAVEFSTWTPHWFGSVDGPAEAIAIFGPHGERFHVQT